MSLPLSRAQDYDPSQLWLLAEWLLSPTASGVRESIVTEVARMVDAVAAGGVRQRIAQRCAPGVAAAGCYFYGMLCAVWRAWWAGWRRAACASASRCAPGVAAVGYHKMLRATHLPVDISTWCWKRASNVYLTLCSSTTVRCYYEHTLCQAGRARGHGCVPAPLPTHMRTRRISAPVCTTKPRTCPAHARRTHTLARRTGSAALADQLVPLQPSEPEALQRAQSLLATLQARMASAPPPQLLPARAGGSASASGGASSGGRAGSGAGASTSGGGAWQQGAGSGSGAGAGHAAALKGSGPFGLLTPVDVMRLAQQLQVRAVV